MKRKLIAGLLSCVVLVMLFASCNKEPSTLTECGTEVISLMAEMIESEDYQSLYNLSAAYDEAISKLREGNYAKSIAVYELSVPMEALLDTAVSEDAYSEDLYQYICSSAYMSLASRVNQSSDVEAVVVSTVFCAQKSFVNENSVGNKIYLYVFESGCPIALTFATDGDNIVRAVGHFILNDAFLTDDEQSIEESCEALGIKGVTVKKQ